MAIPGLRGRAGARKPRFETTHKVSRALDMNPAFAPAKPGQGAWQPRRTVAKRNKRHQDGHLGLRLPGADRRAGRPRDKTLAPV